MTKRILLCDDEVHILRAAEFKLSHAGLEVECALDGQAGWEAIERRMPDLLVTDCQMPRLSGLELVERIRSHEHLRTLPILMLTGKGYELSRQELIQRWGVLDIMAKPFSPRELLARIEGALGLNAQNTAAVVSSTS